RDPARTIPRAIPVALAVVLLVYVVVAATALAAIGPAALAEAAAPSTEVIEAGSHGEMSFAVRIGGAVAAVGVLLSLIAGVSRTMFAMASDRELPHALAAVHPRHAVPYRAELLVGVLVAALVAAVDLRGSIGFSSFCVLTYYAIANAAAWFLPSRARRPTTRLLAVLGLAGCCVLAVTLPLS